MNSQPVFWALAMALLALTLAVLVWPLLRRRAVEAPTEDTARAAVYRDEKRQLDAELAAGVLSAADHDTALRELTRRLGAELDVPASPRAIARGERSAWIAALATVAIVPVGAIVLYLVIGAPDALHVTARARPTEGEIVAMVETLAAKMKANPGDPKGWRLLARSYVALGRYNEAVDAFEQAAQHGAQDANLYADWAEAVALAHDRVVSGKPEQLAQKALALDADHVKALALLATAALERRDFDASIDYWRRVAAIVQPGSEDAAQANAAIAEVERIRETGNATPAGTSANVAAVSGSVEIAPSLASRVAPGDTLFVYARAPNGPRMPLAVSRVPAAQFPHPFRLDDSMGMAGMKLSSADSVVVEARISKSGTAMPQAGDLAGQSAAVKPGANDVHILIDHVVP